jgi:hypothetical protein
MSNKWTPEFEEMWRCRLREMNDDKQPFRKFIEALVESEILDAFKLALDEIERLRRVSPT